MDIGVTLPCEPNTRIVLVLYHTDILIIGKFLRVADNTLWLVEDSVIERGFYDYHSSGFGLNQIKTWYYDVDTDLGI